MRRFSSLLIATTVAVAGCMSGHDDTLTLPTTDLNVTGSFALVLAGGSSLPLLAGYTTTQEVDLVADTLVISSPNTWVETSYYVLTSEADLSTSTAQTAASGTYSIANGQIAFVMLVGGTSTFSGAVSGNALSVVYNGSSYLYSKKQ